MTLTLPVNNKYIKFLKKWAQISAETKFHRLTYA